jgi:ABC-type amino acid transport system permease subunit
LRSVPKIAYVAVALANFIVMVIPRKENVNLLPLLWLLPVLLWSQMGTRERTSNTSALIFSAPHSFLRQLPALWTAGVLVSVASAIGMFVRSAVTGNVFMLATCISGALFIPSLALASGVWSNTPRLFEALYTLWWYIALNGMVGADYLGITSHGSPVKYLVMALVLFSAALARRWWDVERGPAQQLLLRVG